jgi:hypothetical protein
MGSEMTQKDPDGRVTLAVTDVKDRQRLVSEVEGFANSLLQTAAQRESSAGEFVLTFDHDSGVHFALTLHQLLALVRTMEKN